MLKALDYAPPVYAHVPMILGPDGSRLSKRHGAVSVMQFREEGFLPEAVLNYLARLGWSHGDQEIFSVDEMVALFDIPNINNSASSINPGKLLWLNQHYIKSKDPAHVAHHLSWHIGQLGLDPAAGPPLAEVVTALRERAKTLKEMAEQSIYFYRDFAEFDAAAAKHLSESIATPLANLRQRLADLPEWSDAAIHQAVADVAESSGLKLGKLAQPLRVAVTGGTVSPPIDVTLRLLGRARTTQRIDRALEYLRKHVPAGSGPQP
jgi:glutamyl-tRNA synthetase